MKHFIINLSRIPASYNSALRLQAELKNVNINAELFEGSYGDQAKKQYKDTHRLCHPWGFKGPLHLYNEEQLEKFSSPGVIGCFDSHYRLWVKCVELNEPIVIWEDDTHIVRPFEPISWDGVLILASSHTKKMGKYQQYLDNPTGTPVAKEYEQSSLPGAAGYAIHPMSAKKLVEFYKNSFLPADNAVNQNIVKIEIHSHMMGSAQDREKTNGKSSLIRTRIWD